MFTFDLSLTLTAEEADSGTPEGVLRALIGAIYNLQKEGRVLGPEAVVGQTSWKFSDGEWTTLWHGYGKQLKRLAGEHVVGEVPAAIHLPLDKIEDYLVAWIANPEVGLFCAETVLNIIRACRKEAPAVMRIARSQGRGAAGNAALVPWGEACHCPDEASARILAGRIIQLLKLYAG